MGKDLSWLQFATLRPTGAYAFHTHNDDQWNVLMHMVEILSQKHTHITSGKLTDVISYVVNTTIANVLSINKLKAHKRCNTHTICERHAVKTLVYFTGSDIYLPRHPWIIQEANLKNKENTWMARDMSHGFICQIVKQEQGAYTHLHVSR